MLRAGHEARSASKFVVCDPGALARVKGALEDAIDATDELEEQQEEANASQPKE